MATPFFSRSALGPQVTHDSSVISMWRWTLYINPSAKLAGSAFKGQPQSDPLTRLSERSGSGSLPTLPAPALPVARSVHSGPLRKKSVRVTPLPHCSEPSSDPFWLRCSHCVWLPRGLSWLIACRVPWSPCLSWNLPTRSCPCLQMLYFLGCHPFQTPRIHSSLSPGLCLVSPSLTWHGK